MANKSIIIIGAGYGRIISRCYGQMNGYSTKIFEMHNIRWTVHFRESKGILLMLPALAVAPLRIKLLYKLGELVQSGNRTSLIMKNLCEWRRKTFILYTTSTDLKSTWSRSPLRIRKSLKSSSRLTFIHRFEFPVDKAQNCTFLLMS